MLIQNKFIYLISLLLSIGSFTIYSFIDNKQLLLFDRKSNHNIEVIIYFPQILKTKYPLLIISNGFGISHREYTFVANYFQKKGFIVVSIKHTPEAHSVNNSELNLLEQRKPSFTIGAKEIEFVIWYLCSNYSNINFEDISLLGHSHGGNVIIYFVENNKNIFIKRLITFDNTLLPLPKVSIPRVISLRSNDLKALKGILPSKKEITQFKMEIIYLEVPHMEFCDRGKLESKQKILKALDSTIE